MSRRKRDDTTDEELRNIEGRLRSIERASKSTSEEQLFFGISFSLLILFVTLPTGEAASFLQTVFGMSYPFAIPTVTGIRAVGIIFCLVASLVRYYGSMCSEQRCKQMRYRSIWILLLGFEFFAFIIGLNTLSGITLNTGNMIITFSIGILALAVAFLFVSLGEKRMFDFYVSKGLIPRPILNPFISPIFVCFCFAIVVSEAFGIWVLSMGYKLDYSVFLVFMLVLFFVFSLLYMFITIKTSHRRTRGKRTRSAQSKLPRWFKKTQSTNSINV